MTSNIPWSAPFLCLGILLFALWGATETAFAQGHRALRENLDDMEEVKKVPEYGFRSGGFVFAPIPFSNPMLGSGATISLGYLFKTSENAKTSVLAAAGMRSDNGSEAYAVLFNLALPENRWLLKSFAVKADLAYDLYVPGTTHKVPMRQDGLMGRLSLSYGLTPDLSFGGMVRYLDTTMRPNAPLPPALTPDLGLELLRLGVVGEWDTRDDTEYPTAGHLLSFEAAKGTALSGGDRDYWLGNANFDKYQSFGPQTVLAMRASVCGASDATPFFEKCSLGGSDKFRGFNQTQFQDRRAISAQAELRHRLTKRVGMVGFAGAGWVGPDLSSIRDGGTHFAAGAGLRYRVSKKFPVDISVDYVRNNLDDNLLYMYVGQRF